MAKRKPSFTPNQGDFFQQLEQPVLESNDTPFLDINAELVGGINKGIREARVRGLSRELIIDRMNTVLDEHDHITLRQLNAWTAGSKEHHNFPARYLPAFCWATQNMQPLLVLVQSLHYDLVDDRDQLAAELGNKLLDQARNKREINQLQSLLSGGIK